MSMEFDEMFARVRGDFSSKHPIPSIEPRPDMFQSRDISVLKCENFRLKAENSKLKEMYEKAYTDSIEAIDLAHAQNELIDDMTAKIHSLEAKLNLKQTVDTELKEYVQFLEYVIGEANINIDDYRDYSDVES